MLRDEQISQRNWNLPWKPSSERAWAIWWFEAWRCSGSSTDAQQAVGLCPNLTLEMPAAQLRAVGMIYIALRGATVLQGSFIRSKQQPGGWAMLHLYHCVLILHLNAELPTKLSAITFYISPVGYILEQLLDVAFYGDPVESSHLPAVIFSHLILTPHSLCFYLQFFISLFGWFAWLCLFAWVFSVLVWVFLFALLQMTGEVGTAKLQKM